MPTPTVAATTPPTAPGSMSQVGSAAWPPCPSRDGRPYRLQPSPVGWRGCHDVTVADGHNGCDTRDDILRRDLTEVVIAAGTYGCTVTSGVLHDPYTNAIISFHRGVTTSAAVQIDHVVALGDAWQIGAQQLTMADVPIANDPLELRAVSGPINEQKGDADAASWLPPNQAFRCPYVATQVAGENALPLVGHPRRARRHGSSPGHLPRPAPSRRLSALQPLGGEGWGRLRIWPGSRPLQPSGRAFTTQYQIWAVPF